jgi:hypothetical protein
MVCMLASSMLLLLPGVACCCSEGGSMVGRGVSVNNGRGVRCEASGSTFCASISMGVLQELVMLGRASWSGVGNGGGVLVARQLERTAVRA